MINEAEAAKHIANTKGLGSKPSFVDADIAIGVIIIAVAAFDETSVKIIDNKYIIANKNIACLSTGIFFNKLITRSLFL